MSSTNFTPNLGLSQFLGTDKPTWLGDYNSDMSKIDSAVHNLEIGTTSVIAGQIELLQNSVEDLIQHDAESDVKIAANTSSISAIAVKLDTTAADLESLDTRESEHFKTLSAEGTAQDQTLKNLSEKTIYFEQNMNKMEEMVIVNTASIGKLQVRMNAAESDISALKESSTDYSAAIANIEAETDTLLTTQRQHTVSINTLEQSDTKQTSDIAKNTQDIGALSEELNPKIEANTNDITALQQTVTQHTADIQENTTDISALETKTANITDGVSVPFGFGTAAGDKPGYMKSDGSIEPFATASDISGIQTDVTDTMGDVSALEAKTANITDGKALPFSLGIESSGGAYGYIKNGETGVNPFLSADDVKQIVNIQPIESKVSNIIGSPTITGDFTTSAQTFGTNLVSVVNIGDDKKDIVVGGNGDHISDGIIELPFSFGIDARGNYGYIKAGADSVTPFLNTYDGTSYSGKTINKSDATNITTINMLSRTYDIRLNNGEYYNGAENYRWYYIANDNSFQYTPVACVSGRIDFTPMNSEEQNFAYLTCYANGPNRVVHGVLIDRTTKRVIGF